MLRTIRAPAIAVNMGQFRASPDYRAREMRSQSQSSKIGWNLFAVVIPGNRIEKLFPDSLKRCHLSAMSGAMRMSRRLLTREIILAAILDVVLGLALLTSTIYVAGLCLAPAGS
jgi:hypothetical protein